MESSYLGISASQLYLFDIFLLHFCVPIRDRASKLGGCYWSNALEGRPRPLLHLVGTG